MAPVKHTRGVKLLLKVADPEEPGVYKHMCSINAERGVTFTAGTNDVDIPDCDDPDMLAWIAREKTNLSMSVNGSGTLNTPDVPFFYAWWKSDASKECLVVLDVPSVDGGVIWSPKLHLTEFGVTGNRGEKAMCSIALLSDGPVGDAPNAPAEEP